MNLQQARTVEMLGHANTQNRPQSRQAAYLLRVSDTGAWPIVRSSVAGTLTTLASGTRAALGTHAWHTISLGFSGDRITATADGADLGATDDSSYSAGETGLGVVGYQTDQFDNLSVTAIPPGNHAGILKRRQSGLCADVPGASRTNGTQLALWDCNGGAHQQWRVRSDGSVVNVGSGKCLGAVGHCTANSTALEIWTCTGGANQNWRRS